jgi:hypothetical protein
MIAVPIAVLGSVHGPAWVRTTAVVLLVAAVAYLVLSLPHRWWDRLRVATVLVVAAAFAVLVIWPERLPVANWRDWPGDLARTLSAQDGRWLRWIIGLLALLAVALLANALLLSPARGTRRRSRSHPTEPVPLERSGDSGSPPTAPYARDPDAGDPDAADAAGMGRTGPARTT